MAAKRWRAKTLAALAKTKPRSEARKNALAKAVAAGSKFGFKASTVRSWVSAKRSTQGKKTPAPAAKKAKKSVEIRPDVVRPFVDQLKNNLGDANFTKPYDELKNGKQITREELIAIARTFTVRKPSTRPTALKAIWARHHALLEAKAKSEATAGRSAA